MILFELFWSFCKIGFTSFGGLSMVPLINSEMAAHGWMNLSEIADIIAIAEMTPGPLGLNCATFAGMRVAGLLGAFSATMGMLAPTLTICAAGAVFFEKFKNSSLLKSILIGVRPACIGLVWSVIIGLCQTNYIAGGSLQLSSLFIGIGGTILLLVFKLSIPKVILLAAAAGVLVVR